jgi:hypothetical protein
VKVLAHRPAQLLKFMSDPANADEAIDLGLFEPSKPPKSETSTSDPHPPSDEQSKTRNAGLNPILSSKGAGAPSCFAGGLEASCGVLDCSSLGGLGAI